MKILSVGLLSFLVATTGAFVPSNSNGVSFPTSRTTTAIIGKLHAEKALDNDCECDTPSDEGDVSVPSLVGTKGSGNAFRSAILTDVDGNMIRLGDKMGQKKSVVIFLRHLG